jgi:quinol monooxygenase YgiN
MAARSGAAKGGSTRLDHRQPFGSRHMTILRHYKMTAEGRGSDLRSALEALAEKVRPLPGCEGVRLYADPDDSQTFVFIEDWRSRDDH